MTSRRGNEVEGHWVALGNRAWLIQTIWEAAKDEPVIDVPVTTIAEIDEDCWFGGIGQVPTVRAVASHTKTIMDADTNEPIVLSADGQVLDGMHRVAKALIEGRERIAAQRLMVDPPPDWMLDA